MKNQQIFRAYADNIAAAIKATHQAQKKANTEIAPLMPIRSNAMRYHADIKSINFD